ncbi:MAG: NTP transferase domain-containing protein, partial [Roseovarius sp.]
MTPILILAAGQSARMRGRDKLLEPVDGLPLLSAQARKSLAVTRDVFVALPAPGHLRLAALAGLAVTPLFIPDAASGMAASLRGGVAMLPAFERVLILLADLPEITTEDLRTVILAG